MLIIYAPHITSRLRYIVSVLFGQQVRITDSVELFQQYNGPSICYAAVRIDAKSLHIVPSGLLSETEVKQQAIEVEQWNELPVFFSSAGEVPFDLFSASFYLVSRYEEYLPHTEDEYGRYDHQQSLAYQYDFLDQPLVDLWLQQLELLLKKQYDIFQLADRSFIIEPTYDIDVAFKYRYASPFKNIAGFFRDLLFGRFEMLRERSSVYSGKQKDVYDIYEWLDKLHLRYQLNPIYFFLLAEKQKGRDRNVDPHTSGMQHLIQQHAQQYHLGIHPSIQSIQNELCFKREIKLLEYYTGNKVSRSRHHYLTITIPQTYRSLLAKGIKHDYSMGYGAINGFRASITRSFHWYDLLGEKETSLMIHPFCYMDSTAIFHERLNTEMAATRMCYFLDVVKKVNGTFSFVMHNHFLTEQAEWIMWRNLYEQFLRECN